MYLIKLEKIPPNIFFLKKYSNKSIKNKSIQKLLDFYDDNIFK